MFHGSWTNGRRAASDRVHDMNHPTNLTKVNLGCGAKKMAGFLNVDRVAGVGPDLVHDLNVHPYPMPDSAFDEICAYDVIEHVDDVLDFMGEIWRIGKPGATVRITTPHFSCANAFTDPTHQRQMGYGSLDYFTQGHQWSFYSDCRFEVRSRSMVFEPTLVNKVVGRLANAHPAAYERRWAWIFPAWFLYFELGVVKSSGPSVLPGGGAGP